MCAALNSEKRNAVPLCGVFWLATTDKAMLAIVQRHIDQHRKWMIRSYIFTFSFVSFRLLLEIPSTDNLGTDAEVSTTIGWLCWVVPLMGYEFTRRLQHQ